MEGSLNINMIPKSGIVGTEKLEMKGLGSVTGKCSINRRLENAKL